MQHQSSGIARDGNYTSQPNLRQVMKQEEPATPGRWGTVALVVAFAVIYFTQHRRFASVKQKSYILSVISSGIMSVLSLYFVSTWAMRTNDGAEGERARFMFDGLLEGPVKGFAKYGTVYFRSYLMADLLVGAVAYPKQIGLLTGWVHHLAYIGLMYYLDRTHYSALFMLAAVMEIPTFHLGLSTLYPSRFRNDAVFLTLFFLTRIVFHAYLIASFAVPSATFASITFLSELGIGAGRDLVHSVAPGILLLTAMPMHVMWFVGGIKGHLRRQRHEVAKSIQTNPEVSLDIDADEQNSNPPLNVTTGYSPYEDPSPSLASASPGDTPLVTPLGGPATRDRFGSEEGYFSPLGLAGDRKSGPFENLPTCGKTVGAAHQYVLRPGLSYTAEAILAGLAGSRNSQSS